MIKWLPKPDNSGTMSGRKITCRRLDYWSRCYCLAKRGFHRMSNQLIRLTTHRANNHCEQRRHQRRINLMMVTPMGYDAIECKNEANVTVCTPYKCKCKCSVV
ncbi:hypothetical protein DINM_000078 [Dirofilaria immitis]|nr:hypothetical protein [Dirofilaria immitis]